MLQDRGFDLRTQDKLLRVACPPMHVVQNRYLEQDLSADNSAFRALHEARAPESWCSKPLCPKRWEPESESPVPQQKTLVPACLLNLVGSHSVHIYIYMEA